MVFKTIDVGSSPTSLVISNNTVNFFKNMFNVNFLKNNKSNFFKNSILEVSVWGVCISSFADDSDITYIHFTKNLINLKKKLNCLFLRKNKTFNKGRYSRNRQVYRTGVYLCFYINIIVLYTLWFFFYKFTIKFTYLWWLFIIFPASFVFSKSLKYNLFSKNEFLFFLKKYFFWLSFFFTFFKK